MIARELLAPVNARAAMDRNSTLAADDSAAPGPSNDSRTLIVHGFETVELGEPARGLRPRHRRGALSRSFREERASGVRIAGAAPLLCRRSPRLSGPCSL